MSKERALIGKRYRLEREIGRGGMGIVYLATDLHLNRLVAIKVLPPQISADTQTFSRFKNEVFGISRLEHPSIIKVYDAGVQGSYYYVMQYVDGPNLYNETIRRKTFTLKDALPILRQIASALDYAHKKGFIHRDVKPENILLDSHFNAYLVDFGIVLSSYMPKRFTQGFIGTPEYASPEHCKNEPLTGASDQYSFAIIAYEMLAGRAPFERGEDGNPVPVIVSQLNDAPPDPRQFNPELPEHVAKALLRAISKKPAERFGSCQEFVDILSAVTVPPESQFVSKAKSSNFLVQDSQSPQTEETRPLLGAGLLHKASTGRAGSSASADSEETASPYPAGTFSPQYDSYSQEAKEDTKQEKTAPAAKSSNESSARLSEQSFKPLPSQSDQPEPQHKEPTHLSENKTRQMYNSIKSGPVSNLESQVAVVKPAPDKKSNLITAALIIAMILLALGGIGYYMLTKNNTGSNIAQAEKHTASGNYSKAIEIYNQELAKNPNNADLILKTANVYALSKKFDQAAKQADKLASISPSHITSNKNIISSIYSEAAKQALETGDTDTAAEHYEKVIQITPDSTESADALAKIYTEQNKTNKAIEIYEKLLKNKPGDLQLSNKLAQLYTNAKKPEDAIAVYENIIKANAKPDPQLYINLGQLYLNTGNNQKAIENFKKAVDKGLSSANSGLAQAYLKKGDSQTAFSLLKNIAKDETNPSAKQDFLQTGYKLYQSAVSSGKTSEASKYLAELKAIDPSFVKNKGAEVLKAGDTLAASKKYAPALKEYKKAISLLGDNPSLLYKILDINYKTKNYGAVKASYPKVLALNKNNTEITASLKKIKTELDKMNKPAYTPARPVAPAARTYIAPTTPSYPTYTQPRSQPKPPPARQAPAPPPPRPRPRPTYNTITIPKVPSSEVDKGTVIDIPKS